ncbi:MAG: hypothetical protein K8T20_14070 [Planctomycetes bacterium]|nr:hypothetical protein [Planctomycetota bacterium]
MTRACPRCRQSFEPTRSGGLCPHCGHSKSIPRSAAITLGAAALGALIVGGVLLLRPLMTHHDAPPPPAPAAIPDTEFPAARAVIHPPRNWRYSQRDPASVAFTEIFGAAGIRFRVVKPSPGRDAHLALIREVVPDAEPVEHTLPEWPGAEALAVRKPNDARLGASWLIPRGDSALEVLFWGDEARLEDVKGFREGLRLAE